MCIAMLAFVGVTQAEKTRMQRAIAEHSPIVHLRFETEVTSLKNASASRALGTALRLAKDEAVVVRELPSGLVSAESITIECWFKSTSLTGTIGAIQGRDEKNRPVGKLSWGLRSSSRPGAKGPTSTLQLVSQTSTGASTISLPIAIYPNKWYHLVLVEAGPESSIEVYLNAQLAEAKLSGPAWSRPLGAKATTAKLTLGAQPDGSDKLSGQLDEVALYARSLGAADVRSHFRAALPSVDEVHTIGHRGNPVDAPENTLASVRQAIQAGSSIVEIDLNLSRDKRVILLHDKTLDRTTNGRGRPAQKTVAELAQLDAGSWKDARYAKEHVPSLAEAIEVSRGKAVLMLDLKTAGLAEYLDTAIKNSKLPLDQVVFGPWKDNDAAALLKQIPQARVVRIGSVPQEFDAEWFARMKQHGYRGVSVDWRTLPHDFVVAAREHEFEVYTWTVNGPVDLAGALLMNLTGIITDEPASLEALKKALQGDQGAKASK